MSLATKTAEYLRQPGNNVAIVIAGDINQDSTIFEFQAKLSQWSGIEFDAMFVDSSLSNIGENQVLVVPEIQDLPKLSKLKGKNVIIVRDKANLTRSQSWKVISH